MTTQLGAPSAPATIAARNLAKSYGAIEAVRGVSLAIESGEITAIVGDNGAGKSTLIKMIAGAVSPKSGSVLIDGAEVRFKGPLDARRHGIEVVYQDLAVAPLLDVATNLFLGRELVRGRRIAFGSRLDRRRMHAEAEAALSALDVHIPSLHQPVGDLSGGQRQAVAVARGAMWATKLLILDEPTAALGVHETEMVIELMKRIRARGVATLLVSHSLQEVFALADHIVVLRRGSKVADARASDVTVDDVVSFITGVRIHEATAPAGVS